MAYEVGQEVAVQSRAFDRTITRGVVQRVTAGGQVVVAVADRVVRFDARGSEVGVKYNADQLIGPWTAELEAAGRRRDLLNLIQATKWQDLPLATLGRVAAALEG